VASTRVLFTADSNGNTRADVLLSVTPPPQMPATLEAGTISGYCVGEPWNQQAIFKGVGVPVIADYEHLEEQSGQDLRRHQGLGGQEPAHAPSRCSRR
jgi:hypothetical protein